MARKILISASLLAGTAVILGAFAAHGLKKILPPESVSSFQTGVQYQMYHSLALLMTGWMMQSKPNVLFKWAARFFLAGILLFSGSLYLLAALKAQNTIGLEGIGAITPFGGLCFITGWVLLALGWRKI